MKTTFGIGSCFLCSAGNCLVRFIENQRHAQPSRLSESETGFGWSNSLGDFVGLIQFLIIKPTLAP